MSIIKIENLSFGYGSQNEILRNINLNVENGEFVCIVGENGSGKSTLVKCILGLNNVEKNKITLTERPGYLPQITEIQNHFPATIEEIVLSGTITDSIKSIFYKKADKEKAKKMMEKLDLYDIRKKCFYELSGGQKQRVLIARALCSTDKLLILDEPVNGLDPKVVTQIYELLSKLNKEDGLTIIMISHDIDRALKYVTRVVEMENGKIIKSVTSEEYKGEANE